MQPRPRRALTSLAQRLDRNDIPFLLGGSGLLAALDLTQDVDDLDVLLTASDYDALRAAADDWWVGSAHGGDERWASEWLVNLEIDGVEVDAIGGFALRLDHRTVELPLRCGGAWLVDGQLVPLAAPEVWWVVYRWYKPRKAKLLEHILPLAARHAVLRELGLPLGDTGQAGQ